MDIVPEEYIGWIVVLASVVAVALLSWLGYWHKNRRTQGQHKTTLYRTLLKKSTDLQPEEVMGELRGSHKGGFRDYCLPRDEIDQIKRRIADGKDVLVIGNPLAGKSRAVYEALKHTDNPCNVTIPRIVDVNPNELDVRQYISGTRKGVLLLDDLNKYVSKQHFEHLLRQYIDKGYLVIATCRKGPELARAESALEQVFGSLFNEPIELGKIDQEEAEAVANETGIAMPDEYDGNIGSIFVPIKAMRLRYSNECSDRGRAVLRSIKRLFMAGVYEEGGIYSQAYIKKVCVETEGLKLEKFKWKSIIDSLADLSFIRPGKKGIAVEETYIEQIFTFDCTLLENFRELADLFTDDPEALFQIGDRADDTEYSEALGDDYVKVKRQAVDAFRRVLTHWSSKKYPKQHAMTRNNLGVSYGKLADIEDRALHCKKAISAFQEALKILTLERFPMDYAMTQNNLGNVFRNLGDIEDKVANCKRAMAAYQEALKVYTLEDFPIDHAMTQNNMGTAYWNLGDIEDRAANCKRAIAAYQEALKVSTLVGFPIQYATTQNNLGAAYRNLGEVGDKVANCLKAIVAYLEALKVYTLERFPREYAMTQNNLGVAYGTLGDIQDQTSNCKKAIAAHEEALKVYTLERFPMDYAMTQNNLGLALQTLGDVEDKAANCKRAIAASEEALKVYWLGQFPMQYATAQNNLGVAYQALGSVEDKASNCKLAIAALKEALKVYSQERFPLQYAMTQNNLGNAYGDLSEDPQGSANISKAIAAYLDALSVYTVERYPIQYAMTQNNLGATYSQLLEAGEVEGSMEDARGAYESALRVYRRHEMPIQGQMVERNLVLLDAQYLQE